MPTRKTQVENPSDRELVFTRIVDAPRPLVWAAWTDPAQVVRWWGPKGFTTTIHEMNVRPGGRWRLTMHGPDGIDYPNRIEFHEVVKPARLVYDHGDDANPRQFNVTTEFTPEGDQTRIISRLRFRTAAECAEIRKFAADGHASTMERLDALLAEAPAADGEIVIARVFAAPRDLVFRAWTEPGHLAHWWGPKGFTNPVCEWDARPGGKIYDIMRGPDGTDYPMGGHFKEVFSPERLVMVCGALDANGALLFEIQHTVTFAEQPGGTNVTIRSRIVTATAGSERYTNGYRAGMTQSLERLADLLATGSDREIVITRVLAAPRALVWAAWTDPVQVVRWWGPTGFSTTIERMDVRPGGVWQHTMHGPDGTNYPNKSVFQEIVPLQRIVYSHGGGREGGPGASFVATWTFEEVGADQTRLTIRMVFPSAAARDFVVKEFGALEGGQQTLARLAGHLAGPPAAAAPTRDFVLTREFAAPRDLVWQAWTDPAHLKQWFGPKGFTMPACVLDFRPGGVFHYCLKAPTGQEMWGKWVFREIVPREKLVLVSSFSDAQGGLTRHPMSATWPLETLSTTTFTEHAGRTTLTLRWSALNATATEQHTFDSSHEGMTQGWNGTMDQLAAYLAPATTPA